jgi:hypothetical protein
LRLHAILGALMRTPFDQFGKQMVRAAVTPRGRVETDAEVHADTRRIDLWFMPDPTLAPVPDELGLLGRITAGPSTLEFFHRTPSGDDLAACLIKHGEFRHNTESAIIPGNSTGSAFSRREPGVGASSRSELSEAPREAKRWFSGDSCDASRAADRVVKCVSTLRPTVIARRASR